MSKENKELFDLLKEAKLQIKYAFNQEPLIVNKSLANKIYNEFFFIPITNYAWKYLDRLVSGEIGVFNRRRIVINLPIKLL